jgi:hypothetical protein
MASKKNASKTASTHNWVKHDDAAHLFEGGYSFRVHSECSGGAYFFYMVYLELLTTTGWRSLEAREGGRSWWGTLHVKETEAELQAYAEFLIDNKAPISSSVPKKK